MQSDGQEGRAVPRSWRTSSLDWTSGRAFLSWTVSLWYHNNYHNNYPNTTMTSWHQKPQLLAFSAPLVLSAGLEPSGAVSWSRYGQVPWWGGF